MVIVTLSSQCIDGMTSDKRLSGGVKSAPPKKRCPGPNPLNQGLLESLSLFGKRIFVDIIKVRTLK